MEVVDAVKRKVAETKRNSGKPGAYPGFKPRDKPSTNDGNKCRTCGSHMTSIVDSRSSIFLDRAVVRRRHICRGCGEKWTTFQLRTDDLELMLEGASASDRSANIRLLTAMISQMGITPDQIVLAMAEAAR